MFCTQCGEKVAESARFCGSCGSPVSAGSVPVSTPGGTAQSANLPTEQQDLLKRAEAGDEVAMFEFAGWRRRDGDLDTATVWFQKLVELGDPFAAYELARIFEGEDDNQAEKLFLFAARTIGATYAAHRLGDHYSQREQYGEAKKWYMTAIEWLDKPDEDSYTEEDISEIHLDLARALEKLEDSAEAEKWFQKAVDAGNPAAMVSFSIFLEARGDMEAAHSWLKKSADAGHIPGLYFLGWFHEDAGQVDEAKRCYRKAAEADDDDAAYRLGLLYRAEGDTAEATRWLERAADMGHSEAKIALQPEPRAEVVIKTHGYQFSDRQIEELRQSAEELALMVTKYGISATSISEEEAEELAETEPNRLFSLLSDYQTGLAPGFVRGSLDYYPSRIAFGAAPSPYPYTEVSLLCEVCDGETVVDETEDCTNCEDGSHLFDLEWDANGVVTAVNVLPPL